MMSYLSRILLLTSASRGLQDSLKYGLFDERQSRQLFDTLHGVDLEEGHRRMLLGERVFFLRSRSRMRGEETIQLSHPADLAKTSGGTDGNTVRRMADQICGAAYDLAGRNGDVLVWLRFMNRQIRGVRLSHKDAESKGLIDDPHLPFYAVMSNMMGRIETRTTRSRFRATAIIAGDQTLLALIAYGDRYGTYPPSLEALRARLGWKIPEDPFSGKDFIYKRAGKGFILYSIGPDLTDDGGKGPSRPAQVEDKGDMVWRMEK